MPNYTVTRREAAQFFGISVQALDAWFARGAPAGEVDAADPRKRAIDLTALARWRIRQSGESKLEGERLRLTRAQADRAELEAAELAGTLVRADDVESEWAAMLGAVRSRLLVLPAKVAPRARAAASDSLAAAAIEVEVFEALAELSGTGDGVRPSA